MKRWLLAVVALSSACPAFPPTVPAVVALGAASSGCAHWERLKPIFATPTPVPTATPSPDPVPEPTPPATPRPTPTPPGPVCTDDRSCGCWISANGGWTEVTCPIGTPTPTPNASCPPEELDRVDVKLYRLAYRITRETLSSPAYAGDVLIFNVTPKSKQPFCLNDRVHCELRKECQPILVGPRGPYANQTLVGHWDHEVIEHASNEPYILRAETNIGEHGHYIVEACTQWGTHCSTVELDVLPGPR
jgi:hypothetical protein